MTVKRNLPYQILLGICCAVPYLSNYELTFLIWSFTVLITLKKSYSSHFVTYALCFVAIVVLALLSTDIGKSKTYFVIRDFTYVVKPLLGIVLGYQICRYIYKNAFETLIYGGLGIAIIHILIILKTFAIYHHISVALLREHCGYFSDFEVYVLILVIFYKEFNIEMTRARFRVLALIIGFSAFMYLSRTNFIQFAVLYLALKGYFVFNRRAMVAIFSVVITSIVLYTAIVFINPRRTGSSFDEFLYKIKIAPTEPFKTKVNVSDYKQFNINYRSVENIYTLKQIEKRGTKAMILGSGLGSQVDLKQEVFLGDQKLQYISVLHNGFLTTYLKSGIVGVLILLFSIFMLYKQRKSQIPIVRQVNYLLAGTAIFLLVSNWVLMGYYFTMDSKSILVGLLIAYKEITIKRHYENKHLIESQV